MSFFYLIAMAAIIAFFGFALSTREHQIADCMSLLKRVRPYQLSGLDQALDDDVMPDDIWSESGGFAGLWRRWRNRVALVQLAQVRYSMESIDQLEIEAIVAQASALSSATLKSALAGTVRGFFPSIAAKKNWEAVRLYANLGYAVHALYSDDAVPLCASKLATIL